MKLRRYEVQDRWERLDGKMITLSRRRRFTKWGARLFVRIISPMLRCRGGRASLVLVDRATGREEVLDLR